MRRGGGLCGGARVVPGSPGGVQVWGLVERGWNGLDGFNGKGSSQGPDLAVTVLSVPNSLDSGSGQCASPLWPRALRGNGWSKWRVENYYLAEMRSGSEEGSYVRLIDLCITQL